VVGGGAVPEVPPSKREGKNYDEGDMV